MSQNNVMLHVNFQQIPTHYNRFGASNNSSCKFNENSTVQISEQEKAIEVRINLLGMVNYVNSILNPSAQLL
jgi:hypothetical protein